MTVSQARAALPEVLDRVVSGDEVTITRHGIPIAVIVRPDQLRVRRAETALQGAEQVRELLERGRSTGLGSAPTISGERADELVADVQASRRHR